MMKKIGALLLVLVMVLSVCGTALASSTSLTSGEVGGFYAGNVDNARVMEKSVIIQKEIKAYNPDAVYVYGPSITYTYSIAPASGSELVTITDQEEDHSSGVQTIATVLAGVGTPTLTGTGENVIEWTNSDILNASNEGVANIKNLTVNFSAIVFTQPGVYRYKIYEDVSAPTLTGTESDMKVKAGVTDGTISNIRYLDVYVMRSSSFDPTHDGTSGHEYAATDWSIYGYVCIGQESVATNAGGTTNVTESTIKTNGFVSSDNYTADSYYTYNFKVTKDLVGDDTMINHQFPLTVAFSDGPTGTFQLIAETDGSKSSLTTTEDASGAATVNSTTGVTGAATTSAAIKKVGSPVALTAFANAGTPKVADGNTTANATVGYIKYIGIPNTTVVTVTEENDNVGTTYTTKVKEDVTTNDGTDLTDVTLTSTTGTMDTSRSSASIDYQETATRTAATGGNAGAVAKNVDIQFINSVSIISPTGVVMRVAPYVLILAAGIALLIVAARRRKAAEEE